MINKIEKKLKEIEDNLELNVSDANWSYDTIKDLVTIAEDLISNVKGLSNKSDKDNLQELLNDNLRIWLTKDSYNENLVVTLEFDGKQIDKDNINIKED